MALQYKLEQSVLDHYLNSDDNLVKEFVEESIEDFNKYVEVVATHKDTLNSYKEQYSGQDYRDMVQKLDDHRTSIHNKCINDINVIDRAARKDNLVFCKTPGSKKLEDAHRMDLGKAIMVLHAQKETPNLSIKEPSTSVNDPANPNVIHQWPHVRGPRFDIDNPRKNPDVYFSNAQLGDVVSTRVRFSGYEDEPYDIVHAGQDFGYVNAKYRPCMVFGRTEDSVVLAPMYTDFNVVPQMEMKYGGITLTDEECDAANLAHHGGTVLSCAHVFEVPFEDFTYTSLMGSLPMETIQDYTLTFVNYTNEAKTNPHRFQDSFDSKRPEGLNWLSNMKVSDVIESKSISMVSTIHPDDPDRRSIEALNEIKALKSSQRRFEKSIDESKPRTTYQKEKLKEIDVKLDALQLKRSVARELTFKYMVNDKQSFSHEMHLHNQALKSNTFSAENNWTRMDHPSTYDDKFKLAEAGMTGVPSDPYIPRRAEPSQQPIKPEMKPPSNDTDVSETEVPF